MTEIDTRTTGSSTSDDEHADYVASYQRLLDTDTHPVPQVLREETHDNFEDQNFVPVSRYISRKYHELERDRMWYKVWQMACREEEIPEPGDTHVYEICEKSILVVRGKDMSIRAFYNSCLHRGRTLREESGPAGQDLRCPFHGFCWNLDGSLKSMTCEWDFPHVDKDAMNLPQVKVDTWGGFVFINMDPASESLASFLGDLGKHFEAWPLEDRYIQAHVAKVIDANWKIAQEAFSEAFHVITTHPQRVVGTGDSNSQYDSWGNFNRGITANGVPSPHIKFTPSEQEMFDSMVDARIDEDPMVTLPDGVTAREMSGLLAREGLREVIGDVKADNMSDAESLDSIYYTVFPNFHPWGAYQRIVYRFRPNGDDHNTSIMDVYLLAPFTGPRPPAAKVEWLTPEQTWIDATVLGSSARVFDQDAYNMPKVHRGLKTTTQKYLPMAAYQELKIRHMHHLLAKWVGEDVD
ncbi:SRPBCC family protein [Gordonia sp. NPDC058843]|uniref:aromatic ring-hydroxylating oxygenase subunit alpha n=1 Tax=Gordonia sp. NPDC058843 TaxID=3346648 RepID=UPI00368EC066